MGTWQGTGGFSVDGSVRVEGEDRAGLERLVRCCARGPLALERLHAPAGIGALTSPEARPVYRLPGLICMAARTFASHPTLRSRSSRVLWAQIIARIYEVLPLLCPGAPRVAWSGGEMRIISFITLPSTVQAILLHLDLPHRPPRVSPARAPPQAEHMRDLALEEPAALIYCPFRALLHLPTGHPSRPDVVHFVSLMAKRREPPSPLPLDLPPDGEWCLRVLTCRGRFVLGMHRRQMKAIRYLRELDDVFGVALTTRSWNTISRVARVLET